MAKYLMGIDCGTNGVRAAVVDPEGRILASDFREYDTFYPNNGWAEQKAEQWLNALKKAIPECIRKAGVDKEEIAAMTCDATTCTLVFLDENGEMVRDPVLWMDVRAAEEAAEIDGMRDQFAATRFYRPVFRADTLVPKCMWIKRHEPGSWRKTATVFEFVDWVNWKLTGRKTVCMSTAAFRWNYDDEEGGYPEEFYRACGLEDIFVRFPGEIRKTGERIGTVSAGAAELFGLSEHTEVYEGTADCNACMCGVGVVKPGDLALIGGTSTCILGLTEERMHENGINGSYPNCISDGSYLIEGGQTASGAILTWFRDNLMPADWSREASERGMDPFVLIEEKAALIPVGCQGVVMLDSFQGNRTPYGDSKARGMFWGLSLGTTTAHLARAVFEGVAYGAELCILSMKKAGYNVKEIRACGGMSKSEFWMQMHADVTGLPIRTISEDQNAGCLGDCMIAAVGAGLYKDREEAVRAMVHTDRVYLPDPEKHAQYRFYMERCAETWPAMREIIHRTVEQTAALSELSSASC